MRPFRLQGAGVRTLAGLLLAVAVAAGLGGCATVAPPAGGAAGAQVMGANPKDPWEAFNRKVFSFNDVVDENLLQPVAKAYRNVVPELVRAGVNNFFGNLGDAWSAVNQVLQGKPAAGAEMGVRFIINSTFGLGGIFDIASDAGLERRSEDFGQTLGRWGFGPGPFVMLPLFGPSTLRDATALPIDFQASPSSLINDGQVRAGLTGLNVVNTRANLLGTSKLLDDVALDKYNFLRDAFLSRRRSQVYDGDPPEEDVESDTPAPKK